MAHDFYQVDTTTDSSERASDLASGLVSARLAACVHISGPVTSLYRWEGKVQNDQEWQLIIKTTASRLDEVKAFIAANHSYDVPQVVVTPIVDGSPEYLSWVREETTDA